MYLIIKQTDYDNLEPSYSVVDQTKTMKDASDKVKGYNLIDNQEIKGGSSDYNAKKFLEMLNGSNLKFQHIIELNAGAALYLADIVKDLKNGFQLAKNVIDKKISKNYFQKLIK